MKLILQTGKFKFQTGNYIMIISLWCHWNFSLT